MFDDKTMFSAAVNATGEIRVFDFYRTSGRELRYYKLTGAAGAEIVSDASAIGQLSTAPASITTRDGVFHVLGLGVDDPSLYHGTSQQWQWNRIPSPVVASAPAICSMNGERLDAFFVGADRKIWHSAKVNRNTNWGLWGDELPASGLNSAPSATSWGNNRIDLVARQQANNEVLHVCYDDAGGWRSKRLGGTVTAAPTICALGPKQLHVFARGLDGNTWHKSGDGTNWGPWTNELGAPRGGLVSAPVAITRNKREIYLFATGHDKGSGFLVYYLKWDGTEWHDWYPILVNGRYVDLVGASSVATPAPVGAEA